MCARLPREREREEEGERARSRRVTGGGVSKRKTRAAVGGVAEGEDNPVRARWNENAVTRNKRGGDPKLLVEVQPEGLGMSLRRGGDETLP